MRNELLAKSKPYRESLIAHTENVLSIWQELKKRYDGILNKDADFWRRSFLSALFHDFGKVAQNFQLVIHGKKKYVREEYIRHELLSGILLLFSDVKGYEQKPFSLFAVFSHHKALTDSLFQDQDGTCFADILMQKEDAEFIYENFLQKMKENGFQEFKTSFNLLSVFLNRAKKDSDGKNLYYNNFYQFLSTYKRTVELNKEHRKEYILYKALLNISDWTASGHSKLQSSYSYTIDYLKIKIVDKLHDEGKTDIAEKFEFRQFQLESLRKDNVLAIAPTGSGKTEAALIWATHKPEHSKILYLLPTRVTSNAIYKRLAAYFGQSETAIVHSSAFLYRKEIEDNYEKTEYLKDKTFFKNITVCTIDQVLTQGFNLGYWEIKTFHLINARIIIDEIHLFEPYTLGLIIATIKYLKSDFGAMFYIMTATMPTKLKNLLSETLQIKKGKVIEDEELLLKSRNTFETRIKTIEESEEEVLQLIASYNKVLIVVNTVDAAINLYNKLKEKKEKVICFHSRFIQKHRQEKETDILEWEKTNDPILLIATQIVEVSLDIDYDILITENAPIDSIIQRAGRVNRKRKDEKDSKIIIFRHHQVSEENIYKTVPEVLSRTFDELNKRIKQGNGEKFTEKKLIELVDIVYADFDVTAHPDYIRAINIYKEVHFANHYIKDVIANENTFTRLGLDTVNVIPNYYYEYLQDKDVIEKSTHEVPVRKYRASGHKIKEGFTYVNYWYDNDTGLQFIPETKIKHTMSC